MKPDAKKHCHCPKYIRALVEHAGGTQASVAKRIGIAPRTLRDHLFAGAPYTVQYALEGLVGHRTAAKIKINVEQQQ